MDYGTETYYSDDKQILRKSSGLFSIYGSKPVELEYDIVDHKAIYQGDIILGDIDDLNKKSLSNHGAALIAIARRWYNYDDIPYVIDDSTGCVVNQPVIMDAINYINAHTRVKLVPKTARHIDYILIKEDIDGMGSSYVGCKGGEQIVHLNKKGRFKMGNVMHEISHALGLFHEQSRQDRNTFVTIVQPNIRNGYEHDFDQKPTGTEIDYNPYDYLSVMHYSQYAFGKPDPANPGHRLRTIITADNSFQDRIGQRDNLSVTDIAGLNELHDNHR